MMLLFPYNFIAGAVAVGLAWLGILYHDHNVFTAGDKAGYSRAVKENEAAAALVTEAYVARADELKKAVEAKRKAEEELAKADAEADEELDAALAASNGKEHVAWSASVAKSLRR